MRLAVGVRGRANPLLRHSPIAILLARAMAATFVGRRVNNAVS